MGLPVKVKAVDKKYNFYEGFKVPELDEYKPQAENKEADKCKPQAENKEADKCKPQVENKEADKCKPQAENKEADKCKTQAENKEADYGSDTSAVVNCLEHAIGIGIGPLPNI